MKQLRKSELAGCKFYIFLLFMPFGLFIFFDWANVLYAADRDDN